MLTLSPLEVIIDSEVGWLDQSIVYMEILQETLCCPPQRLLDYLLTSDV